MRRALLAVFAFLLGLGGAVLATHLTGAAGATRQGDVLGPIDLESYCRDTYGERAIPLLSRPVADGWQCAWRPNGIFDVESIDIDNLCRLQYGEPSFAVSSNPIGPLSWECRYGTRK
jgi:hypothetical protein